MQYPEISIQYPVSGNQYSASSFQFSVKDSSTRALQGPTGPHS